MDKEFIVLGQEFVKYSQGSDNEYEVHKIHKFEDNELDGIVARVGDKVIFIYDRHVPKETREIVGEATEFEICEQGVKCIIKWNDVGRNILANEKRYPSVELKVNENNEYELYAIAMVGEPASKDVSLLELSSQLKNEEKKLIQKGESKMENKDIVSIIESSEGKEDLATKLMDIVAKDPEAFMPKLIEALVTYAKPDVAEGAEAKEAEGDKAEGASESEGAKGAEAKEAEAKEAEGTEPKEDDLKASEKEEKESQELTALAYEYAQTFGKGTPTASSLLKAIDVFNSLKTAKLPKTKKQEIAFAELKFVKEPAKKDDVDLSANSTTAPELGNQIYDAFFGK